MEKPNSGARQLSARRAFMGFKSQWSCPILTTLIVGSCLVLTNHGRLLVAGEFPAWWVVGVTYVLVYCAFVIGGLCAKLKCSLCMRKMLGMSPDAWNPALKTFTVTEGEQGNDGNREGSEFGQGEVLFPMECDVENARGGDVQEKKGKSIYGMTLGRGEDFSGMHFEDGMDGIDRGGYRSLLQEDERSEMVLPIKKAPMICCESSRSSKLHESASSFGPADMPGMFESSDFQGMQPRSLYSNIGEARYETLRQHLPRLRKPEDTCQPGDSGTDIEQNNLLKTDKTCQENAFHAAWCGLNLSSASLQGNEADRTVVRRSQSMNTKTFLNAASTREVFVYKNALFLDNFAEFDDVFDEKTGDAEYGDGDKWKHMPHST